MSNPRSLHRPTVRRPERASSLQRQRADAPAGRRLTSPPAGPRPAEDDDATRRALVAQVCALGAGPVRAEAATDSVWRAWEAVPEGAFRGATRRVTLGALVAGGGFARLAWSCAEGRSPDDVVARMLLDPTLSRLAGFRHVVMCWVAPLRVARADGPALADDEPADESGRVSVPAPRAPHAFACVERQKAAIVALMDRREEARAWGYAEELLAAQLRARGGERHAVRSLCDLAVKADARGLHQLQLRLTSRAVAVLPDDGWSWQQHSVALRRVGRMDDAAAAARRSSTYRQHPAGDNALADALRGAGRLVEALAVYEAATRRYPDNVAAWLGQGEVLKALGRTAEAFAHYSEAARRFPACEVALGARADSLRLLGRLPEALAAFEDGARWFPHNTFMRSGRAAVLRAMGRLDESLAGYEDVLRERPDDKHARAGHAAAVALVLREPAIARALARRR